MHQSRSFLSADFCKSKASMCDVVVRKCVFLLIELAMPTFNSFQQKWPLRKLSYGYLWELILLQRNMHLGTKQEHFLLCTLNKKEYAFCFCIVVSFCFTLCAKISVMTNLALYFCFTSWNHILCNYVYIHLYPNISKATLCLLQPIKDDKVDSIIKKKTKWIPDITYQFRRQLLVSNLVNGFSWGLLLVLICKGCLLLFSSGLCCIYFNLLFWTVFQHN